MTGRGSSDSDSDGGNGDGAGAAPILHHHHPSRRARRWCCIPGCTLAPDYTCAVSAVHEDDGAGGAPSNGQTLYCKQHKGPCCAKMDDGGDSGGGGAGGKATADAAFAIDAARIANAARTAMAHLCGESDFPDIHTMYALTTILELCGPVHGVVHMCACGCPASAHRLGHGACSECGPDRLCKAMRRPGMNMDDRHERLWDEAAARLVAAAEAGRTGR